MSTRSYIGVQKPNASIEAVYCHFDGHPRGVGRTLHAHHDSLQAATSLLELGDLSSLGEKLAPEEGETHDFHNPASRVTVAYARDRGEIGTMARNYVDIQAFVEAAENSWVDYIYLFREGAWFYTPVPGRDKPAWTPCDAIEASTLNS